MAGPPSPSVVARARDASPIALRRGWHCSCGSDTLDNGAHQAVASDRRLYITSGCEQGTPCGIVPKPGRASHELACCSAFEVARCSQYSRGAVMPRELTGALQAEPTSLRSVTVG